MAEKKGIFSSLFNKREEKEEKKEKKREEQEDLGEKKEDFELTEAIVENTKLILQDILTSMGLEVSVEIRNTEKDNIDFEITGGDDLGLVIGKEGNTLSALQTILTSILSKKYKTRIYINIDANKYKARKDEAIINAAIDAAEVAEKEGIQIVLDPMNARERRLVHMTLKEKYEKIETFSRGDSPLRQVVVSLKGQKTNDDDKE